MTTFNTFNNLGYVTHKFDETALAPIKLEVKKIKDDFSSAQSFNYGLAGHLKHEYQLIDCRKYVESLVLPYVIDYDKAFNYFKSISVLTKDSKIVLDSLWVNFQRKCEFNPVHNHTGIMSFVIWLNIPYTNTQENQTIDYMEDARKRNGNFCFLYTNSLGEVAVHHIPVDKEYEGTIAIFPAKMSHCVYPFFSSDEYRVTVSGNFKISV